MRGLAIELGGRRGPVRGAGFDFSGGTLPAGAALTRASVGMRTDATGKLATAAADVPRFDFDPATLGLRGLLIEPARTNLLREALDLAQPAWLSQGGPAVSGGQPDPAGGTQAIALQLGGGDYQGRYQPVTVAAGVSHAHSVYVRAAATGSAATNLLVSNNAAAGGTGVAARQALVAAWRRQTAVGAASDRTTCNWSAANNYAGADNALDPDSYGVRLLYGAQLEAIGAGERAEATSLIATTGAAATRAADRLTLRWGDFGIADGELWVRYTFDDGSTQQIATTVAGGAAVVPTNLNRRWLRRADQL